MFISEKELIELKREISSLRSSVTEVITEMRENGLTDILFPYPGAHYVRKARFPAVAKKVDLLLEHFGLEMKQISAVPEKDVLVKKGPRVHE